MKIYPNVVERPIDCVKPYSRNAKRHPERQIERLATIIAEFGWDQPIVVDGAGVIIKGHGRLLAARRLGLSVVPVVVRDDLSPEHVKAARIADNKIAETEWDVDSLKFDLFDLSEIGLDLGLTGFEGYELDQILAVPEQIVDEPEKEWEGMPEYTDKNPAFRKIVVNFDSAEDVEAFFKFIGQDYSPQTRFIWFPKKERRDLTDLAWAEDNGED